jgi:hypothetical protein
LGLLAGLEVLRRAAGLVGTDRPVHVSTKSYHLHTQKFEFLSIQLGIFIHYESVLNLGRWSDSGKKEHELQPVGQGAFHAVIEDFFLFFIC